MRLDFLRYIFSLSLFLSLFLSFQRTFKNKSVQVERMCLTPWHFIRRLVGLFSISSELYLKIDHSYREHTKKKAMQVQKEIQIMDCAIFSLFIFLCVFDRTDTLSASPLKWSLIAAHFRHFFLQLHIYIITIIFNYVYLLNLGF